eukprot:2625223-Pleurochrysis_carterae.AAC.1
MSRARSRRCHGVVSACESMRARAQCDSSRRAGACVRGLTLTFARQPLPLPLDLSSAVAYRQGNTGLAPPRPLPLLLTPIAPSLPSFLCASRARLRRRRAHFRRARVVSGSRVGARHAAGRGARRL